MAFRHVQAVMDSYLPAPEKLVALAVAESASLTNDQAWLAWDTIGQRASCTKRGAQKIYERLEQMGVLAKVGKHPVEKGWCWVFQINIGHLPMVPPDWRRRDMATDEHGSSQHWTAAAARATPTDERDSPVRDEPGSPRAEKPLPGVNPGSSDERKRPWGERGDVSGMNESAGGVNPGSSKSPFLNQEISESIPGHSRRAGQGPAGLPANQGEQVDPEIRVMNNSARLLGIPPLQPGETLEAFNRRIGDEQLRQLDARRAATPERETA